MPVNAADAGMSERVRERTGLGLGGLGAGAVVGPWVWQRARGLPSDEAASLW